MEFVTDGDVLIAEQVRQSSGEPDRVADLGLPIWVIIDSARVVGFDSRRVAERYGLAEESVEAAFRYYETHKPLIDAQISTCVESYS
jgi:uncharacterized protein (DUF433 family)